MNFSGLLSKQASPNNKDIKMKKRHPHAIRKYSRCHCSLVERMMTSFGSNHSIRLNVVILLAATFWQRTLLFPLSNNSGIPFAFALRSSSNIERQANDWTTNSPKRRNIRRRLPKQDEANTLKSHSYIRSLRVIDPLESHKIEGTIRLYNGQLMYKQGTNSFGAPPTGRDKDEESNCQDSEIRVLIDGKKKRCKDVSKNMELCKFEGAYTFCPETCGTCQKAEDNYPTGHPSANPSFAPSSDQDRVGGGGGPVTDIDDDDDEYAEDDTFGNDDFEVDVGPPTLSPTSTSTFATTTIPSRIPTLYPTIPIEQFSESPTTSPTICTDSKNKFTVEGKNRKCKDISKKIELCELDGVSIFCPVTCGTCNKIATAAPTQAPISNQDREGGGGGVVIADDDDDDNSGDDSFEDDEVIFDDDVSLTTSPTYSPTISPTFTPTRFPTHNPSHSPTISPVNCADSNEKFEIEGKKKKCKDVSKKMELCNSEGVSDFCPVTCGTCHEIPEVSPRYPNFGPTAAPTLSPIFDEDRESSGGGPGPVIVDDDGLEDGTFDDDELETDIQPGTQSPVNSPDSTEEVEYDCSGCRYYYGWWWDVPPPCCVPVDT